MPGLFNLSSIYLKDEELKKKLYTITYRPPEILQNKATLKSDIYALGCTFFEIYSVTNFLQKSSVSCFQFNS